MTLEINADSAMERIDEFLEEIDELLDMRYSEGKEQKLELGTKLDNFAEVAFSDGDNKRKGLHSAATTIGRKSEGEKQREYEQSLKRKQRKLKAWKQQINLEEENLADEDDNKTYPSIEEEISNITNDLPIYADDLEQSLNELQKGHLLASVLITGRVIDYTIDQIKSSQKLGGSEEVLEHLEDEIMDDSEAKITDAVKSYRDKHAHEIGNTPDDYETLIILLGCAKLLHNIQEAGRTKEYDLA